MARLNEPVVQAAPVESVEACESYKLEMEGYYS